MNQILIPDLNTIPRGVVGIGASAGGLEALQQFLQYLPENTDLTYVIVQHLSPDYKSLLKEILSKYTKMPVLQAKDGMVIKKNTIYLIPPKFNMELDGQELHLSEYDHAIINHPIDIFFRSLARFYGHKSVTLQYNPVIKKAIEDAKKNLSGFSTFVISIGNTISNVFSNAFKNIWYATDPTDELQKNLDEVRKKIKDVSATLESNKSWGISGDPKLLNSLKEQERMIISQIGAQVRLRGEEERRRFLNAEHAKDQEAIANIQKESLAFAS